MKEYLACIPLWDGKQHFSKIFVADGGDHYDAAERYVEERDDECLVIKYSNGIEVWVKESEDSTVLKVLVSAEANIEYSAYDVKSADG